ncbi:Aldose 1-epimerase [Agrobacterium sp. DSM 25558]|uniref:aldose 1-epimerase n=1 Tax=Agrobacterium sp. DSM 25558 TaxID=1907665 RepID=UPI0009724848|nr:aldose 1-epimerase [Agrobacterium sp. DSM 25558]SCX29635.1 Aldose 1-epimerase [Agrobacterium sp. DSM 25558]
MSDLFFLKSGRLHVQVSPHGGAIRGASYEDIDVLMAAGGPQGDMASFPLVPFGNRVEFNRFQIGDQIHWLQPNSTDPLYLHGDGWLRDWQVEAVDDEAIDLTLRQKPDHITPYDYTARQRISVDNDTLRLDLSVTSMAADPMPFGLGHHPFFIRTPLTRITASVADCWSERDGHLPGGKDALPHDLNLTAGSALPNRFLNNAFGGWNGRASIDWVDLGLAAEIDTTPHHNVLMLYAPLDRQEFFCLEPMTHLPNGHHMTNFGGLALLHQGMTIHSCMTIEFRRKARG